MANLFSLTKIEARLGKSALNPHHAQLRAVIKNSKALKYCIPNEIICAEIGRFLGLPVPPCGLVYVPGHDPEHWFASLNFNLTATDLPPIDPINCVKELPSLSTGVVLFDVLIGNNDRHRANLHLDTSQKPPRLTVFDHSHALFGPTNGAGEHRLAGLVGQFGIGAHCLLNHIPTDAHLSEWCGRIKGLPNYLIEGVCESTVPLGMITAAEAAAANKFLIERKANIETIIKANKIQFRGIAQWGLFT